MSYVLTFIAGAISAIKLLALSAELHHRAEQRLIKRYEAPSWGESEHR